MSIAPLSDETRRTQQYGMHTASCTSVRHNSDGGEARQEARMACVFCATKIG